MTILDVTRLPMLARLADAWPAPVSAAILADRGGFSEWALQPLEQVRAMRSALRQPHLMRATLIENVGFDCPPRFPFNQLRNIALSRCVEQRVVIIDVDFVPHPADGSLPRQLAAFNMEPQEALVLPAFDVAARVASGSSAASLPAVIDKSALRMLVANGQLVTFGDANGTRDVWSFGHRCTITSRWLEHSKSYEVQHCNPYYEPYIMLSRATAPPFDESFRGRGIDKISYIYELFARGVTFKVSPDAFVIHHPHSEARPANCSQERIDAAARAAGATEPEEIEAYNRNPGAACTIKFLERLETQYGYAPKTHGHGEFRKNSGRHWLCDARHVRPKPQPRLMMVSG